MYDKCHMEEREQMKQITDEGVLLIYCLAALIFVPADTAFVVAFLTAVVYVSVCCIGYLEKWNMAFTVLFLLTAWFCPQCLIFTPAVLYGFLQHRNYLPAAALAGMCVWFFRNDGASLPVYTAVGTAAAILLWERTSRYEKLSELFRRTRDDSMEVTLLLKEKNQALLENQDYEVYTATLKERNRIAREIHDNVGHMLSRAILLTGAMKAVNDDKSVLEPLKALEDTLNMAMTNVRESVHDLHDDSVNLKETLEGLAADFTFCPVELTYDMGCLVPGEVRYGFIMIVKEALHNVAKHSNAARVQIIAREHPALYQLIIEDNGTVSGSRNMSDGRKERGIGIHNMQDRIRALNGTIQIDQRDGFRIFITVPKKEDAA